MFIGIVRIVEIVTGFTASQRPGKRDDDAFACVRISEAELKILRWVQDQDREVGQSGSVGLYWATKAQTE